MTMRSDAALAELRRVLNQADDLAKITITDAIKQHWRDEWQAALLEVIRAEIDAAPQRKS